jgi:hypothetical protein
LSPTRPLVCFARWKTLSAAGGGRGVAWRGVAWRAVQRGGDVVLLRRAQLTKACSSVNASCRKPAARCGAGTVCGCAVPLTAILRRDVDWANMFRRGLGCGNSQPHSPPPPPLSSPFTLLAATFVHNVVLTLFSAFLSFGFIVALVETLQASSQPLSIASIVSAFVCDGDGAMWRRVYPWVTLFYYSKYYELIVSGLCAPFLAPSRSLTEPSRRIRFSSCFAASP